MTELGTHAHQGAGAGRGGGVPSALALRGAQVRGGHRRRRWPVRRGGVRHARRLPRRILAGHQPPDPQRDRAPQRPLGHAVRGHRRRRAGRRGAGAARPISSFLVGIYAFGAMLAFTIAHALGDRIALPRARPPSAPTGCRCRSPFAARSCPMPAVVGALASGAGWMVLMVFHSGARYVGLAWLVGGLLLYVIYRKTPGEAAAAAGDDPRAGAPLRGARAGVRLDPRADPRHARSTTTSSRRLAGWPARPGTTWPRRAR